MIHGTWDRRFVGVVDAFHESLARTDETGGAVSLSWRGEPVVDVWAGTADLRTRRPWARETCCMVFSCTKALTATVVLWLVDAGRLDLDRPLAQDWPAFAGGGRDQITPAMVLSHTAGLPALDEPMTVEQANDGASVAARLATQRPRWIPGREHGYHALTYGWLLGELVRRVTGRTVGEHLAVLGPVFGGGLWLGAPAPVIANAAYVVDPLPDEEPQPPASTAAAAFRAALRTPDSEAAATLLNPPLLHRALRSNRPDVQAAEWPAATGIATARGLAGLMAAVSAGRVLEPGTLERATTVHASGPDRVLHHRTTFGLGFMLPSILLQGARPGAFGHSGAGGSLCVGDPGHEVGFGYVTNLWGTDALLDPRGGRLLTAAYEAVDAV